VRDLVRMCACIMSTPHAQILWYDVITRDANEMNPHG
jgi:hypothetical protein